MTQLVREKRSAQVDYETLICQSQGIFDARARLVVRPDLTILWCSANARRLLARQAPLTIQNQELLFADTNRADAARSFLESVGPEPARHLLRAPGRGRWAVLLAWRLPVGHRAIAIVCSLSAPCRGVADSGLAEQLNLTRSEACVLDRFAQLRTPREIAAELEISVETVRSHLKQIYSKAEVESGVQLLRLTDRFCSS